MAPNIKKLEQQRQQLVDRTRDNKQLEKNSSQSRIEELQLANKPIKIQGIDHPTLKELFPLSSVYIKLLSKANQTRTKHTYILEFHQHDHSPTKVTGPVMKLNIQDFQISVLSNKPITFKGNKYLSIALTDDWGLVLLPLTQRLWYR